MAADIQKGLGKELINMDDVDDPNPIQLVKDKKDIDHLMLEGKDQSVDVKGDVVAAGDHDDAGMGNELIPQSTPPTTIAKLGEEVVNVPDNKMAISIPSQDSFEPVNATNSKEVEQYASSKDSAAYVSPAHNGLIPTSRLKVMCNEARNLMQGAVHSTQGINLVSTPISSGKHIWNINAPSFVPSALKQLVSGDAQSVEEGGNSKKNVLVPMYQNSPGDVKLLEKMDLHDIRDLLERQNSPPKELPEKVRIIPPGFVDEYCDYKEEDEESMMYNLMEEALHGGLSLRVEQANKPKLVRRERAPLEPRRVQLAKSSKSRSTRGK